MTRSHSMLCNPFVAVSLIAGGAALAGCADLAEPTTGSTDQAIGQPVAAPVTPVAELRVAGDRVVSAPAGWTETAPGTWASATPGLGRVVIGAEGHRLAIAAAEKELAALRERGNDAAIEQQEVYLESLEASARQIATRPPVTQAVTCDIGFVLQASSPIFPGFIGAFAGAVLSCTGGLQVFTVPAQACTNIGCGPVGVFTPTIGATPQLFGVGRAGAAGAACFGAAFVSPPGVTGSAPITCG